MAASKKAGVVEHRKMLHHVGLLFNRPSGADPNQTSRVALHLVIRESRINGSTDIVGAGTFASASDTVNLSVCSRNSKEIPIFGQQASPDF